MSKSHRHELGVGVLVLGAALLLAWMALQVGALRGLGKSVQATVHMDDAAGLAEGGVIKVAGVDVGRISAMGIEEGQAVLTLDIKESAGIRKDARVQVRARSVLGEKFLELQPGTRDAPLLEDGDELAHGRPPVEIDQLVNELAPLVEAVDPQVIEGTLGVLQDALQDDPERVKRMLDDLEVTLDGAAAASAELPALVAETRTTLASVRRVADEARPVIARADRITTELEQASRGLEGTRAELDGLLSDSRQVVQDGGELVQRLEARGDSLERILDNLEEIDKWELRRLLREEGIVVRLKAKEVQEPAEEGEPQ